MQFQENAMWEIDKHNGKMGCAGKRPVHGITTIIKAYHKAVYRRQNKGEPPDHCFSLPGMRREEAIATQMIQAYKLRRAGIPHTTDYEDSTNAFPSVEHR